jgi:hypothetical protein
MAIFNIVQYRVMWDYEDHFGKVQLRFPNGEWSPQITVTNPTEFQVLVDLLRNEQPVFFDSDNERIQTGPESVGEQET